uniref:Family with sequence similarity 193 member A n=1 Tax=Scleropages formosus TaxID=113540 RepID=A0A8C9SD02_SCLFO
MLLDFGFNIYPSAPCVRHQNLAGTAVVTTSLYSIDVWSPCFSSLPQTPFTFGLGQRAPYTGGERCLLCRSERKDCPSLDGGVAGSSAGPLSGSSSSSPNSLLQLPLWVCPECRRTVETEERPVTRDQPILNQDYLLHMPLGSGASATEPVAGSPTLPGSGLTTPLSSDPTCSCEACVERREISVESERESQQLQNYWSEVRYLVRCIYRQTGTPLADDRDQPLDRDKEGMKELVDRLCEKDPYQLYQRLEQQAREYVLEMKVRLLKHLSAGSKASAPAVQGPSQAHQFMSLLLEEYRALCQAARTISSFLLTLENEHLQKFQVTWELHNKHLFENLVFSEPILHNTLPSLVAQHGTASRDSYSEDMYRTLLESYHQLDREMNVVAVEWLECEKRIDDYVDEQVSLKTKQRLLKEEREFFKQRRLIEEQLTVSKKSPAGEGNFTDTMRQMLSSRLNIPDCPNCNYRRRCTCDDCSLSHILTCGIVDSPVADEHDVRLPRLPLPPGATPGFLHEAHPPSVSSASSGSGSASSSPVTVQQHPRLLLLPDSESNFPSFLPLLSADIYPLNSYSDAKVVAVMNGIHGELNGGGEKMAQKNESPRASSSSSSSSSEADEEEADRESAGEPPGQQGVLSPEKRGASKETAQAESPPPSYSHQQTEPSPRPCECHACSQALSGPSPPGPPPARSHHTGHPFLPEKASHPALHLYPHIHGHMPLHGLSHLPRPLHHPTVYPGDPLQHSKTLPSAPISSHASGKHQVFAPSLPDHVYQSCFGNGGDWNGALQCPSLKLDNIWDTNVMKSWNPAIFLQESLPGEKRFWTFNVSETRKAFSSVTALLREKKNGAKKKCLFNFQDAFMEAHKGVLATSSSSPPVSCTATTTTQCSKFPGEVFHSVGKEDHRHPSPTAPRNSPTGLASLPPLSSTPLPPVSTAHLPSVASPHFPKRAAPAPGFLDASHQGLYLSSAEPAVAPQAEGCVSAPPSVCSDPDCDGHRCEANSGYDHQPYDGEESQDEDSCSEHSSSTSTSTNQKEGKYCDCCYCEFFGHGGPPAAPTSRNFAEMREKLRLRLTKRKEEQPKKEDHVPDRDGLEDNRKVEDLLRFINSTDSKPTSGAKAAKRARHKQKKMEEKARVEAEAREKEERQREEDALKQELLRLQELQHLRAAKKKKKDKAKEAQKPDAAPQNPQPLKESAQKVLDSFTNGKTHLLHNVNQIPAPCTGQAGPRAEQDGSVSKQPLANGKDTGPQQVQLSSSPNSDREKLAEVGASPRGHNGKSRLKQPPSGPLVESGTRSTENTKRAANVSPATCDPSLLEAKARPCEEPGTDVKKEDRTNTSGGKKQLNHVKEEKVELPQTAPPPQAPPLQADSPQLNGKAHTAESPQPKGKAKKNKKKKGDKTNNSIDDVFLPKDIDLDSVEMDETEREVEYFKRFCLDSARQTRQRLSINWSNFSLKKATFAAH